MAEPLNAPFPRPEPHDLELHDQVDDLRVALRDWRRTREYSESTQKRLEQLTLQCAQLMETWQQMQRRTGPPALTGRGPGTGDRIRALERAIENEWEAVPTGPDDPSRQISEQAASLVESCVAATHLALRGYENAENRVAALEREIQTGLAQVSRDLQQVVAEIRTSRAPAAPAAPFPLEGVMRIHQELRESGDTVLSPASVRSASFGGQADAPTFANIAGPGAQDEAGAARSASVDTQAGIPTVAPTTSSGGQAELPTFARAASSGGQTEPPDYRTPGPSTYRALERRREPARVSRRQSWPSALIVLVAAIATFASLAWLLQRRIDTRLFEATRQVAEAEKQRDALVAETRQEAARQIAEAQRSAANAHIVGAVMAAPDVVRYWLTGFGESRANAHVLVSRSRGLVFSASRLDPAGNGRTYQLWLVTTAGIVSGGTMTPDPQGRITHATEAPVILPGRLTGAMLTLENVGGAAVPSADRVLVQVE